LTAEFKISLSDSSTYHIVLDNTFSLVTEKAVVLNVVLEHTE